VCLSTELLEILPDEVGAFVITFTCESIDLVLNFKCLQQTLAYMNYKMNCYSGVSCFLC